LCFEASELYIACPVNGKTTMNSLTGLERLSAAGKDSQSERRKQPGDSRPPVAKKRRGGRLTESRRKEIVRKAAQLFLDKGYERVTVDDIIALVGGSKATLYSQFGGKDGLFEIVIKEFCTGVDVAIEFDNTATAHWWRRRWRGSWWPCWSRW